MPMLREPTCSLVETRCTAFYLKTEVESKSVETKIQSSASLFPLPSLSEIYVNTFFLSRGVSLVAGVFISAFPMIQLKPGNICVSGELCMS